MKVALRVVLLTNSSGNEHANNPVFLNFLLLTTNNMDCSAARYRIFLVCCNIGLLFVGLSVMILALNMNSALSLLMLDQIPILAQSVKALIATGFFIALVGSSGICGACYKSVWLLTMYLGGLGVIVVMEFCLGVIMMVIKTEIENSAENENCGKMCMLSLDTILLDYAMPSAGIMMTVIILEAVMIYSAVKMLINIRNSPKVPVIREDPATPIQSIQMQNISRATHTLSRPSFRQTLYSSPFTPSPTHLLHMSPSSESAKLYRRGSTSQNTPIHFQDPPTYAEVIPQSSTTLNYMTQRPSGFWRENDATARVLQTDFSAPDDNYMHYQPGRLSPGPSLSSSVDRSPGRPATCSPTRRVSHAANYMEVEL